MSQTITATSTHQHLSAGDTFGNAGGHAWRLLENPRPMPQHVMVAHLGGTFRARAAYSWNGKGGTTEVEVWIPGDKRPVVI